MTQRFASLGSQRWLATELMNSVTYLTAAILNILITVWAVQRTMRAQHRLDTFSSRLRLVVVFAGAAWFFAALHFIGSGLVGTYVAFIGGLTSGIFLFFPDASFYLGKYLFRKVHSADSHPDSPDN